MAFFIIFLTTFLIYIYIYTAFCIDKKGLHGGALSPPAERGPGWLPDPGGPSVDFSTRAAASINLLRNNLVGSLHVHRCVCGLDQGVNRKGAVSRARPGHTTGNRHDHCTLLKPRAHPVPASPP